MDGDNLRLSLQKGPDGAPRLWRCAFADQQALGFDREAGSDDDEQRADAHAAQCVVEGIARDDGAKKRKKKVLIFMGSR